MHLSAHAQQLLDTENITALQALSYEELLPAEVRQEILNAFLTPERFVISEDSLPEVFHDPVYYNSLTNACVFSSGQIVSQELAVNHIAAANRRILTCPLSRKILKQNIGNTRLAYVLLPKIDEVIRGYKALRTNPTPVENLLRSFNPMGNAPARVQPVGPHSSMAALHFAPSNQRRIRKEAKESASANTQDIVGTLEFKVARNKFRMVIALNSDSTAATATQLTDYFLAALPGSQVNLSCKSYQMNADGKSAGRCWKTANQRSFELDLWFPANTPTLETRTFSNHHVTDLLLTFSKILYLSTETDSSEAILAYSVSTIEPKVYIVALEATPASLEQIKDCCRMFLENTKITAEKLDLPINDTVIEHHKSTQPSLTAGPGTFGSNNINITTTSSQIGSQFTQRK